MTSSYEEQLQQLTIDGRLRKMKPLARCQGPYVNYRGQTLLNCTSNDYLGIGGNTALQQEFYSGLKSDDFLTHYGLGAASSRLLTGDCAAAHILEKQLATIYNRPCALLFNSGYHANIGILPALTSRNDLILSDKLNHASIHDGLSLCRAVHKRFRHCNYEQLHDILTKERHKYKRVIIVTESIFSMDGDEADLQTLIQLKNEFKALLYVDEAHAVGLYGRQGLGKAEEFGVIDEIDLLVGTFGKGLASLGAFVVCDQVIYDLLVNTSRALIFTTALPPVVINWTSFVVSQLARMTKERGHLKEITRLFRAGLKQHAVPTRGTTNVVPIMIGNNDAAVRLAEKMQEHGFLVFPVRPPAVPEGTARFRISLTADMTWPEIEKMPELLADLLAANRGDGGYED